MESGSKLDPDPETESGSDSLIAKIFYLSFFLYRSTVLPFYYSHPVLRKKLQSCPGQTSLGAFRANPAWTALGAAEGRSRRAQPKGAADRIPLVFVLYN
jgi:hypothetical protein